MKDSKTEDKPTGSPISEKYVEVRNNMSENEVVYFQQQDNVIEEFKHLLNLPFLEKFREDTLFDRCHAVGWTKEQVLTAQQKSVFKSNWNKDYYIKHRLESIGRGDYAPTTRF